MADEWVTLRHRETGGVQQFAPDSVDAWKALGWLPLDETPEPPAAEEAPKRRADSKEK